MLKNKTVIYTAISAGYDDLVDPKYISPNCDYICFTDDMNLKSDIWNIKKFPNAKLDSTLKNRFVKILPHLIFPNYKFSLYIDGNIDIIGDVELLVEKYIVESNYKIAIPKHPERNCLYQEAKACIDMGKDKPDIIDNQIKKYREEGFPKNIGLTENNIIFREHNNKEVKEFMDRWWKEYNKFSKRDQLSFRYISWKYNYDYNAIDINSRETNSFFKIRKHKLKGIRRIWQLIRIKRDKNVFNKTLYNTVKYLKEIINNFR